MVNLKIGWILPNTLNLHGERGNILALKRFADKMSCEAYIDLIDFEKVDFNPVDYDILFVPPGSTVSSKAVIEWLNNYKESIIDFIEMGRPLLVTGTSVAFFGNTIKTMSGEEIKGLGIIDVETTEREVPYGDDLYYKTIYSGEELEIIGNQIQMVNIELGEEKPFGNLIYGYGNSGRDRSEGAIKNNSIFTNTLGPLLINNPWLTVKILGAALKNKGVETDYSVFDWELEITSFKIKKDFILSKKTELSNCNE